MAAPDIRASAYVETQIDEAIVSGASACDKFLRRTFFPLLATRTFDWPNMQDAGPYRLWFDGREPVSLTTATSGGVNVLSAVKLRPQAGPPYTHLDLDRGSSSSLGYSSGTGQDSVSLTGLWMGCPLVERSVATLTSSINSSVTTVRYTPATGARPIEVGHTLRVGSERLLVNEKAWVDSTQTGSLAVQPNANTLAVVTGSAFRAGEELLLDSERVLVTAVAGNNLTVRRAWSGTTLAAHTTAAVYWPRDLTVTRGALGTTAAAGTAGDTVLVHVPPAIVAQLNRAYALDQFFQEGTGYARTVGADDALRQVSGKAIRELEERAQGAHGRKVRMRAV